MPKRAEDLNQLPPIYDPNRKPKYEHEEIAQVLSDAYEELTGRKPKNAESPPAPTKKPQDNPSNQR